MKKMVIMLLLTLGLVTRSMGTFAQDIAVTVYADQAYPPYSYLEKGEVKGIYTEILQLAFSQMRGYNVQIEAVPWKRGLMYIESGTGLALYPPYSRPQERPWMEYSDPILDEELVVFMRADLMNPPRTQWVAEYAGLQIGINAGFASIKEEDKKSIRVLEVKDTRSGLLNVAKGMLDGYVNDRISILWTIKQLKATEDYDEELFAQIVQGATLSKEQGFVGFTNQDQGKFAFKDDFKAQLNGILNDLKQRGEIQRIIDQYIK